MNKLLGLIIGLAVVLRLIGLNQSFWLDEAAQVIESARPLNQQLNIAADFQPPGLHLLLHFWMLAGTSEVWIRLLSVLFALGSISMTYLLGKKLVNEKTGLLAALFLAVSPYHLWYSQEARPYMMLVFISSLATYLLLTKRWLGYALAVVACWFSTYFAPFVFISHLIYLWWCDRKSWKSFLSAHLAAGCVFLLWVPFFLQQLSLGTNGLFAGWSGVVSMMPVKATLLTFAKFIFGKGSIDNNLLYGLIILPVFLLFLFACWKSVLSANGKKMLIFFFVPFIVSILVTFFVPILAPQRLTFLLPIFSILLAYGIEKVARRYRWLGMGVVLVTSLAGVGQYYTDPTVQREQWREAVAFVEQQPSRERASLFVFPDPFAPYLWYRRTDQTALGIAPLFQVTDTDFEHLRGRLASTTTVYLFGYLTGLTDPQGKTQRFLEQDGFRQTETKNFEGVGFIYVFQRV